MNRRLLALAAGAASLLPGAVLTATTAGAAPAPTVGPTVTGWWSAARPDSAVPAVPTPDAGPGDLYVAGSHALPALPDGAPDLGPVGPVALSALRFDLPDGATAGELRLRLAGTAPPFVTLTACRALGPFSAEQGGSWADAPAYDCVTSVPARVAGDGQVVLDGVDRLRRGTDLSLVLVPGPLDRVVLAAPGAGTLSITEPTAIADPPAPPAPAVTATQPGRAPAAPTGLGLPVGPLTSAGSLPGPASVAPSAAPSAAASPLVAVPLPAAASTAPGRPWPVLVATLALALLAFVPLTRPRSAGPAGAAVERGVGRFRTAREGRAPDLA